MDNPSYEHKDKCSNPPEGSYNIPEVIQTDLRVDITKDHGQGTDSFVPGGSHDPHRGYRIGKQVVLVLVYIGLVS